MHLFLCFYKFDRQKTKLGDFLSLSLSLSQTHTHRHSHILSHILFLSLLLSLTFIRTYSLSHTHTHILSLSLSLPLSLSKKVSIMNSLGILVSLKYIIIYSFSIVSIFIHLLVMIPWASPVLASSHLYRICQRDAIYILSFKPFSMVKWISNKILIIFLMFRSNRKWMCLLTVLISRFSWMFLTVEV